MHAASDKGKHEAWLEAWTELKDGRFSYEIVTERGSDMARGKVLRSMLQREMELVNKRQHRQVGPDPGQLRIHRSRTRQRRRARRPNQAASRNDVLLVEGRAVLNDGGDLLRVEGRLSKNPSFWTSLVNIVRRYARIGGVRVPVATETTAKVKFVGTARMEVALRLSERQRRCRSPSASMRSAAPAHIAAR